MNVGMTDVEPYRDENGGVDEEDEDDSPKPDIVTSPWRRRHQQKWTNPLLAVLIITVIVLTIVLATGGSKSKSSTSSNLATSPPQQQQQQQQQSTPRPHTTRAPGTGGSTTSPPVASPSLAPGQICPNSQFATCYSDELPHETPLMASQALCAGKYEFGITGGGSLMMFDCSRSKFVTLATKNTSSYFSLSATASLRIVDVNQHVIWHLEPKVEIPYTEGCTETMDCPFLSLRSDGTMLLKYVDNTTNTLTARNVELVYKTNFRN